MPSKSLVNEQYWGLLQRKADEMHRVMFKEVERLIKLDPKGNSKDGRKLARYAKALEEYEKVRWACVYHPSCMKELGCTTQPVHKDE